ncbi:MAG: hypothetical protein MHM6MM_004692 [Cercozoa sp. M6MM]
MARSRSRSRRRSRSRSRRHRDERPRPRRFPSGWDVTPEQMSSMGVMAMGSLPSGNTLGGNKTVGHMPPTIGGQGSGAQSLSGQQRLGRRLYVGNLPMGGCREDELRNFFNDAYVRACGGDTNPDVPRDAVISVYLNSAKRFGFLEMRSMADATNAANLDGIEFKGLNLKINRPSEYNASDYPPAEAQMATLSYRCDTSRLGIISTQVVNGPNKIFCGGLPFQLAASDIRQLFETYGPLRGLFVVKNPDMATNKGFCFFEYADPSVTQEAIKGLNGLVMGDRMLTVRLADAAQEIIQQMPPSALANMHAHAAAVAKIPKYGAHLKQAPAAAPGDTAQSALDSRMVNIDAIEKPSRVLCLLQMVTRDDLCDEADFIELRDEIKSECASYGIVHEVTIPRPLDKDDPQSDPLGVGKVFVLFDTVEECTNAKQNLEGRTFDERTIVARYFDEGLYHKREFVLK